MTSRQFAVTSPGPIVIAYRRSNDLIARRLVGASVPGPESALELEIHAQVSECPPIWRQNLGCFRRRGHGNEFSPSFR